MRRPNTATITIGVIAVAMTLIVARAVYAQVPTVKAKGKAIEIMNLLPGGVPVVTTVDLFTVPAKRRFIVTDIIFNNDHDTSVRAQRLTRNGGNSAMGFITIPANSAFSHSFGTGLVFEEGDVIGVRNGDTVGPTEFTVTGYLTK